MAATLQGEYWAGRRTRILKDFSREHIRVFKVKTSLTTDDGTVVALVTGLPVRGSVHPGDTSARCCSVEPTNTSEDPNQWDVICTYSTDLDDFQDDPTQKPTTYDWSTEYVDFAIAEDLDGLTIENSAHETFEKPCSTPVRVDVIKATCTRLDFHPDDDKDPYIRRVNSKPILIDTKLCQPGQLILWDLGVAMVEEQGLYYRKYEYTWKIADHIFDRKDTITQQAVGPGFSSVIVGSVDGIEVGAEVVIDTGANQETITVVAVDTAAETFSATFTLHHAISVPVTSHRFDAWQYVVLDQGFNEWDPATEENVEILSQTGQPLQVPSLLDGEGSRLATWDGDTPVFLHFRTIDSVDFNEITFP